MDLPPYSKKAHAHALVMSGILLGLDQERVDREVSEDTGFDPDVIRDEIRRGEYNMDAMKFLTVFDKEHQGMLTRVAVSNIATGLLNLR